MLMPPLWGQEIWSEVETGKNSLNANSRKNCGINSGKISGYIVVKIVVTIVVKIMAKKVAKIVVKIVVKSARMPILVDGQNPGILTN